MMSATESNMSEQAPQVKEEPVEAKTPKGSGKKSLAITVEQIQDDRVTEV